MAVDQNGGAEIALNAREYTAQGPMIGLIQSLDAADGVVDGNPVRIDLLRLANDPRDRPKATGYAHGSRIGKGRQPAFEHARIELVRLAVHVDIAAGEVRPHERIAAPHHTDHKLIDEGILGPPQGCDIKPGSGEERARIDFS